MRWFLAQVELPARLIAAVLAADRLHAGGKVVNWRRHVIHWWPIWFPAAVLVGLWLLR